MTEPIENQDPKVTLSEGNPTEIKTTWTAEEVEAIKQEAIASAHMKTEETIQERLARQKQKLNDEAEKAKQAAREAKLAEDNEHKTLAEERATQLAAQAAELESARAQAEALALEATESKTAFETLVNAQVEDLGLDDSVKALVMALAVPARSDWVAEHGATFRKTAPHGIKATPRGGPHDPSILTEEQKKVTTTLARAAL